jgi:hypothetical protein
MRGVGWGTAAVAVTLLVGAAQGDCQAVPPPGLAARADSLYTSGDWRGARAAYDSLTRVTPKDPRAWYRMAVTRAATGDTVGAVADYRRVLDIVALPLAMYNVAALFAAAGQDDSAFHWLGRAADVGARQLDAVENDARFARLRGDGRFADLRRRIATALHPCRARPEARLFDFWLGSWDVLNAANGQAAGSSSIVAVMDGCGIVERWAGVAGDSGTSLNAYNPVTGTWQQTWVDDRGTVTEFLDGVMAGDTLVFPRSSPQTDGSILRLEFVPLPDGSVRQISDRSRDGGKTWAPRYVLQYVRRP